MLPVLLSVYAGDSLDYLNLAVDSILSQTLNGIILYVGVDGMVGNEMSKYLDYINTKDDVQVVRFEHNRGLACVLNDLIKICQERGYKYFARMDADDISLPDRLEKQLKFLEEHEDVDVVGGAIEEIDENGNLRRKTVHYPLTNDDCRKFFRFRDPIAHPVVMFRARFFDKVKGYREEYIRNQDTMLWFDAIKNVCVFANLPDTILQYRVRKDYYSQRLGNWTLAKQKLKIRMRINRDLHYGLPSYFFAFALFGITILPSWLKRWLHKMR